MDKSKIMKNAERYSLSKSSSESYSVLLKKLSQIYTKNLTQDKPSIFNDNDDTFYFRRGLGRSPGLGSLIQQKFRKEKNN
ncbi:hypothetical protein BpHYR1_008756 [Brachionus plicatilis]|uniref:Uncharacterized protein n=1 Tax=Brachionus plicatilis TaxID=10195 RepID=A0A3M7RCG3_BRAPC|nr:hypothetical protein BpHYR1_008756 [Brachionus plicatilis]